jgi:hypothetical protein
VADGIEFDFSELNKLAADIDIAADGIAGPLKVALNVTSNRIKRAAQRKVGARRHFRQAARAITFDVNSRKRSLESEIGYEKGRGGAAHLGNLIEFGAPGSPNALTPGNELASSLAENEEDFMRGVLRAVDDAMRKADL